jgi:hypothetical protein
MELHSGTPTSERFAIYDISKERENQGEFNSEIIEFLNAVFI